MAIRAFYSKCPHDPKCDWKQRGECVSRQAKERKRTRHVFSSGEVPHLWYHKTQDSARNATGSLYFEGDTVYSYGSHFPIARHVSVGKKNAVLFTTRTYSVTTSGHCSSVRSAIPSDAVMFEVPEVFPDSRYASNSHEQNKADYLKRIETAILSSVRARSSFQKEYSHKNALELCGELRNYCKFFRIKTPKLPTVPALDSKQMAELKKRESKKAAKKAEETKLRREQEKKDASERLELWRDHKYMGWTNFNGLPVALRISTDGKEVETSLGARVPVSHAIRALRFVRETVKSGQEYVRNGHTFHIGPYAIDRITTDGTLTAGCHVIKLDEIERLAPMLESLKLSEVAE